MYAIIETGGKQFKVQAGDVIRVEKLNVEAGANYSFVNVLAVSNGTEITFGAPYVSNATVDATVVQNGKGKKVIVFKYKPKTNSKKKNGHRQPFTELKIEKINA